MSITTKHYLLYYFVSFAGKAANNSENLSTSEPNNYKKKSTELLAKSAFLFDKVTSGKHKEGSY